MKNDVFLQRLCLILAFHAMISNGKVQGKGTAKRVIDLARAINDFANMHFAEAFPSGEAGSQK